jgi:metallo-beta-lactamase family protein
MRLQFLGATDTVTGSKTLVQHPRGNVLVDCGLFQGYKQLRLRNWAALPVPASSIASVVLTHAHLDHSGWLPVLVRQGFRGTVYCTPATRDLCRILLLDAAHLQEEEAEYANRHDFSRHRPALSLFTREDALAALQRFHTVAFGVGFSPAPGLQAEFTPAGHLLGSAFVRLEDDEHRSILFSGDIGRPTDLLLQPPIPPRAADAVVVESTYGDRLHGEEHALERLGDVIRRTAARGGVVLIPAFAVGRAQALLHLLRELRTTGRIPGLPVFLNSPMASAALDVYREHGRELRLDRAALQGLTDGVEIVQTPDESRALNARRGPMVIIAGSGMATGGRIVHHLKAFAPGHRNTIVLAGHQAGGTRGAALLDGSRTIRIHGEDVPVRAEVAQLENMSAHADAREIVDWLRSLGQRPRKVFINHGEPAASDALRQRIERELGWDCQVPCYLETVVF